MAGFFKNKAKDANEEKTETSENIEKGLEQNEREIIDSQFSIHTNKGERVSEYHKEYMEKEIEELPPIKKGDINISGIYLYDVEDQYEVKVYIRNGFSNSINFDQVPFMIVNGKGDILAQQIFDLKEMGDIPPLAAKPWKLYFDKSNVNVEKIEHDDWKIVFNSNLKAIRNINTVFEGIPESLDEESRTQLDQFLESLPILKEGDFNISTFYVGEKENGGILIIFVMRNGMGKDALLEQIPVTVKDDNGKLVAGGIFDTNLTVSAHKAKICNLEFAPENVSKGDVNLNKLEVFFNFDENAKLESKVEQEPVIEELVIEETVED